MRRSKRSPRPGSIRSTARGRLKRAIQQQIENPLAKEILAGKFVPGDVVKVGATGGEITFAQGLIDRVRRGGRG